MSDNSPNATFSTVRSCLPARCLELLDARDASLDWTGRQIRGDKRGSIPDHLSPILQRIGLDATDWCDLVKKFGRTFKRVAGTSEHLAEEASRRGQHWFQAPGNALTVAS